MIELAAIVVGVLSALFLPRVLSPLLLRLGVVDIPNSRSSHDVPTIRGMGLSTAIGGGLSLCLLYLATPGSASVILGLAIVSIAAAVLGFVEDVRGIATGSRALLQIFIGLAFGGYVALTTGTSWFLLPVLAFVVVSYVNVANFMDGVDGISGLHGGVVGLSYALIGWWTGTTWMLHLGMLAAGIFLAFLPWNISRKRVFLGDVGSYLLGAWISGMAIMAIVSGVNAIAVAGPLVIYLADTGTTLLRRIQHGERWFEAHRSHVYQRLATGDRSHLRVAGMVSGFTAAAGGASMLALFGGLIPTTLSIALLFLVTGTYLSLPAFTAARASAAPSGVSA
jgi:UDP-N-acetylmuramyl pentapeptide phosphotransferase/UDP-N-acetylglucosamine-1-phosphate transferase